MSLDFIRSDNQVHDLNLERLARRYGAFVPKPPVRRLVHRHDQERGLVFEVGQVVPEHYAQRGAVVLAILGDASVYCVIIRRPGLSYEDRILVGMTSVERVEGFDE